MARRTQQADARPVAHRAAVLPLVVCQRRLVVQVEVAHLEPSVGRAVAVLPGVRSTRQAGTAGGCDAGGDEGGDEEPPEGFPPSAVAATSRAAAALLPLLGVRGTWSTLGELGACSTSSRAWTE